MVPGRFYPERIVVHTDKHKGSTPTQEFDKHAFNNFGRVLHHIEDVRGELTNRREVIKCCFFKDIFTLLFDKNFQYFSKKV